MASIHGKKIGGQTYYYLREVARVDGKPKVVSQRYLGKAADIVAAMDGAATLPERTSHRRFGDVAAVWGMCQQLQVAEVVDEVVGERRADASASVGTYLALATVNRIVDPCSKRAFADWWDTTAGPRFVRPRLAAGATDHRRFWDAMDTLTDEHLVEIERRLSLAAVETFDLDLSGLVLDMANFATFIDTANGRAPIAQRGKAKQKRHDLRLVGLALVVTSDGAVPILSHAYPGNRHDSTQFTGLLDEIVNRWTGLGGDPAELTITYDSGQNSADNHTHIERLGLGYVTSMPPSDHPELLAIPHSALHQIEPDVEASCRQMNDPHVVSFSPMHHWTEQKIKVHAFYCVLALQIAHLMRRHTRHAGLDLSVRGLLAELAGIEETVLIYPSTGGRPKARRMLTDTTPTQQ